MRSFSSTQFGIILEAVKKAKKKIYLDTVLLPVMGKNKLEYDEDGVIYSSTMTSKAVADEIKKAISKYAAVYGGEIEMAKEFLVLKVQGKNDKVLSLKVFPDGSSELQ